MLALREIRTRAGLLMSGKIVRIVIPDGPIAQGSKVYCEDGSAIGGIRAVTLKCSVDDPVWRLSLDINPCFQNQLPIEAELIAVGIGNIKQLTDEQLAQLGLQRIKE